MEQVELKKRSDPQAQKIGPVNGLLFYGFSSGVEGMVAWSNWHLNSLLFSFKFLTRKPFVIHSIGTPHINGTACLVAMVTEESMDPLWWPLVNGLWTIPGGDICVGELSYNQLLRTEKMRKYGGHLVANKVRLDMLPVTSIGVIHLWNWFLARWNPRMHSTKSPAIMRLSDSEI